MCYFPVLILFLLLFKGALKTGLRPVWFLNRFKMVQSQLIVYIYLWQKYCIVVYSLRKTIIISTYLHTLHLNVKIKSTNHRKDIYSKLVPEVNVGIFLWYTTSQLAMAVA